MLCSVFPVPPIGEARAMTIKRLKKRAKEDRAIAKARARADEIQRGHVRAVVEAYAIRLLASTSKQRSDAKTASTARRAAKVVNRERKSRKLARQTVRAEKAAAARLRIWDAMFVPFTG